MQLVPASERIWNQRLFLHLHHDKSGDAILFTIQIIEYRCGGTSMDSLMLNFIVLDGLKIIGLFRPHKNLADIDLFVDASVTLFALAAGIVCARFSRRKVRVILIRLLFLIFVPLLVVAAGSGAILANVLFAHSLQIGLAVGMLLVAIDLADRCNLLRQENLIREKQQNELTRFLAVASHDLRQPMHALNIYLGSLLNVELTETAKPLLTKVCQCVHIMDEMFLGLLDLSKLNAQVVKPRLATFPVASVLARLEVEFSPQARAKGLDFEIEATSAWVESDPALVEQILRNLIANAVRYTVTGRIDVVCSSNKNRFNIAVRDTGVGISLQQQKTVFDEFFQIANVSHDQSKGLGLGLAIVRRLCKLLNVSITLVSEPGQGSTFSLDFPLIDSPIENISPERGSVTVNQGFLLGKLVVVIENEGSICDAMRTLLEQGGCAVVTAASSCEAIEKISLINRTPDVLICDYRLSQHETGIDAIGILHEKFSDDISAMLITGDTEQEIIQELLSSGFIVMYKPVKTEMLLEVLAYMLN
ncbi:hybrid sensor histidine kinase/response regulator [Massilia sp. erpn]|uniref:ATP-binding response regulator n=1 Tax=Massilia sp. erpn TaxID=2738142 RepID=UPI0021071A6D|nr:ATP-binding protein [Massilia sp. erpn]UTY59271.1 response regulator [Massilia sp. erpn]